jgi:hypothetical protein
MKAELFLKWDAIRDTKGKHGKFDNLWLGPFQVIASHNNNTYELAQIDGELFGADVNGSFKNNLLQY